MLPAQPNQSLIDGVTCMQALVAAGEPVGCGELARRLGMEVTRANRLLKTLVHLGMARQLTNRKYAAGSGLHVLSAMALHQSRQMQGVHSILAGLRRRLHPAAMKCVVGVLWQDQVSYLCVWEAQSKEPEPLGTQKPYAASISAVGLALLASQEEAMVKEIYHDEPVIGFPGGINALLGALEDVRQQKFAYIDRRKIGPPYVDQALAIAVGERPQIAVGLAGRFRERDIPHLSQILRQSAAELERV